MQVQGLTNIWAAGDIAALPFEKTAYGADLQATHVAKNIMQAIQGKELQPYPQVRINNRSCGWYTCTLSCEMDGFAISCRWWLFWKEMYSSEITCEQQHHTHNKRADKLEVQTGHFFWHRIFTNSSPQSPLRCRILDHAGTVWFDGWITQDSHSTRSDGYQLVQVPWHHAGKKDQASRLQDSWPRWHTNHVKSYCIPSWTT